MTRGGEGAGGDRAAGPGGPEDRWAGARGDLAAFYAAGYAVEDPEEAARLGRWRALGARTKAEHAFELCRRAHLFPTTLVEIGCGDGALLMELSRLAAVVDGFELSPTAIALARARRIPGARRLEAYDGAHVPADDGAYDLVVLSHVLEHVPEPAPLLAEAARVGRHVLVEVPLEANRSASRPGKRAEAARIGHLHAFDRAQVRALIAEAGLRRIAELTDPLPYAHHAFFGAPVRAAAKWAVRAALWRAAPTRAERLFTVHYAALCR
jgi:SAM-dependent methyltransferase